MDRLKKEESVYRYLKKLRNLHDEQGSGRYRDFMRARVLLNP